MIKKLEKGYGILLIGILLSVVPYLITDFGFQKFPDQNIVNIAFWSFVSGTMAAAPFFLITKKKRNLLKTEWKDNKKLLLKVVVLTGCGVLFWFYAMKFGKSGIVSFLKKTDIVFSLLLGMIFLKEKITNQELIGALLAIIGFFFMSYSSIDEISGIALGAIVITQIFYVLQSFFVKRDGQNINSFAFTFLRLTGMAIVVGLFGLFTNQLSIPSWDIIVLFGSGQVFGAFLYRVAYFEAHKYLEISKISIFLLLSPVLILFSSWLFLDEEIHTKKIIGAAIILAGLTIFTLGKIWKKKSTPNQ